MASTGGCTPTSRLLRTTVAALPVGTACSPTSMINEAQRNAEGRVVRWYALLTDIDDRKSAEEALRGTQTRLSRARQAATVAELSASIAHEINQPLASVVTNAHACQTWLAHDPPNLERAQATLERIIRDGH